MKWSKTWNLSVLLCLLVVSCSDPIEQARERLRKQGLPFDEPTYMAVVKKGSMEHVQEFLTAGIHPDSPMLSGDRPLVVALRNGNIPLATLLLDHGASFVDARDDAPVLRLAIARNAAGIVDSLLGKGASSQTRAADDSSLLANAIRDGFFETADVLIARGFDPDGRDVLKRPALHHAIDKKNHALIKQLIAAKADVTIIDAALTPALITAMRLRDDHSANLLLINGADVNATGEDFRLPLTIAIENRWFEFAQILLDKKADPSAHSSVDISPIHQLLDMKDEGLPLLPGLVKAGADLEVKNSKKHTPLELLLSRKKYGMAKLLLDHGAAAGHAVYFAAHTGDTRALQMLMEKGFSANPTNNKDTPLGAAVRNNRHAAAKMLLENGAAVDAITVDGQRPLHRAVATQNHEMTKLLLAHGASVKNPFEEPVAKEFRKLVKHKRMQWFLREDKRVMPLMVAADTGDIELAKLLLESGANVNDYTRKHRMWAINFAARNDDIPMMRLMLGKDPHYEDRKVIVDLSDQRARVFGKDGKVIMSFRVSSGKKGHRTPKGTFVITNKYKDWTSTLYHSKMPYFQRLNCGDFGLHEGYVPKHAASHGCIRVPKGTARKLYQVTKLGDRVEIVP